MAASQFRDLFAVGAQLVDNSGNRCAFPNLPSDGVLGLFFTAHCFGDDFTPTLIDFYQRLKQRRQQMNGKERQFEVIVVSLDDDQTAFDELRAAMPWPALKTFDEIGTKLLDALRRRYHYRRLPTLILVDSSTGRLISDIGRHNILKDPNGDDFPWYPPSLSTILSSGRLLNGFSESVESRVGLEGKLKGLYFSSLDCAPCQEFTPQLIESYLRIKTAMCQFEIILVSGDDTESEFSENYSSMPWLALPFGDIRTVQLESHFQVYGYPQLVLLDQDNEMITTEGCSVILNDPKGWNFPWPIQHVEELSDDTDIVLRFLPCLVLLTGGREDLINQAIQVLAGVASDYHEQVKATRGSSNPIPDLHFFYEGHRSSDVVKGLTSVLQLTAQQLSETVVLQPRVVLVDMKDDRYFVCWSDENSSADAVTDGSLRHLVNKYRNGTLALKSIPEPLLVNGSS